MEEELCEMRDALTHLRTAVRALMESSTHPCDHAPGTVEHAAEVAAYDRAYERCAAELGICSECGSDRGHKPTCSLASGERVSSPGVKDEKAACPMAPGRR